jgi:hypothetical protein
MVVLNALFCFQWPLSQSPFKQNASSPLRTEAIEGRNCLPSKTNKSAIKKAEWGIEGEIE